MKLSLRYKVLLALSCLISCQDLYGQADSTYVKDDQVSPGRSTAILKIYNANPAWEIPVSTVIILGASYGVKSVEKTASLTEEDVLALNPESINAFDRPAAYYNPENFNAAQKNSDLFMTVFTVSPILLFLDKKIRKDWLDIFGMLLVAHAVDNTIFFSSVLTIRRPRPLTYNPALVLEAKTGDGKTNSFFSGHVSWTATSSFFIAKVYTDYHHIKGWKRMLIYTAAVIPPTIVGYYRIEAGSHFKTDVITAIIVGAISGIGVPELHRIKNKVNGLSARPFSMLGSNGISLSYTIK